MSAKPAPEQPKDHGATAVITHRVRQDRHADYEQWLNEIAPLCKAWPGHLDWHIVRPIPGLTETYTVVIRFDAALHLNQWMASPERARLIEKAQPMLVNGDNVSISSGLDFWFPATSATKVPVRWKQYILTWSAIYPLALGVPWLIGPILKALGIADVHLLSTLAGTAVIVFFMVYLVMPRYTKLVHQWLFR
jgi:uncharacterized protein